MPTSTVSSDLDRYRDDFAEPRRGDDETQQPEEPRRGGCSQVAKGCGCVLLVLLLAVIAGGVWLAMSWKRLAVNVGKQIAQQVVADAPLAEADRRRILAVVDKVGNDFATGRIDLEKMERIMEAIVEGPLLPLAMVVAADAKYLQPSGLERDEKLAGRRTIERLARAVVAEKIQGDEAEAIMRPVLQPDEDGDGWTLKERLSDDELRTFLRTAKAKVDELGIVDEPFDVDVAGELEKAIDKAVGRQAEAE